MKPFFRLVSVLLIPLIVSGPVPAQVAAPDLQLKLVESEGTTFKVSSHTAKGLNVQVTEVSGAGVADAAVVLHLPEAGVTGQFADGTHAAVAYTDQSGIAHFSGIQWSSVPGDFDMRITATKGVAHAGMLLQATLVNELPGATVAVTEKQQPTANSPEQPAALPQPAAPIAVKQEPTETSAESASHKPTVPQPGSLERIAHVSTPASSAIATAPSVSVSNTPAGEKIKYGGGKMKWILIAAIAVGAGAGFAMAGKGKSSSSSSSSTSSSPTIGTPTISIGQP